MSKYMENKKFRESMIGSVLSLCKTYHYELDGEQLKNLKRMKNWDLSVFAHELMNAVGRRQNEVLTRHVEALKKTGEQVIRAFGREA